MSADSVVPASQRFRETAQSQRLHKYAPLPPGHVTVHSPPGAAPVIRDEHDASRQGDGVVPPCDAAAMYAAAGKDDRVAELRRMHPR